VFVNVVEKRSEYAPGSIQFIVTDKVTVISLERVEKESLVCLRDIQI